MDHVLPDLSLVKVEKELIIDDHTFGEEFKSENTIYLLTKTDDDEKDSIISKPIEQQNHRKRTAIKNFKSLSVNKKKSNPRKTDTSESDDKFICDYCNKKIVEKRTLTDHLLWHLNPYLFKCGHCLKYFKSGNSLRGHKASLRHLNTVKHRQKSESNLTCKYCSKTFCAPNLLRSHEEWHENPNAFKCEECNFPFKSKKWLVQHRKIHQNPDLYKCKYCENRFAQKTNLKRHEKSHSGKKHKCPICLKSFVYLAGLEEHMFQHSEHDKEKVTCEFCKAVFASRRNKKIHSNSCSKNI